MSSRRRHREQQEHERMGEIYDRFAQYVRKTMQSRKNPNLCVRDFSDMPKAGVTHMEAVLEQVDSADKKLFTQVEAFVDGAYLQDREDLKTGSRLYVAFLPYKDASRHKTHEVADDDDDNEQPTGTSTQLLLLLICILLAAGFMTASQAQINYVLGRH